MGKSIHRAEYRVFVALLRELREQAAVTQVELSAALGRSQSFVSDFERGQRRLDLIELRDVCNKIDVGLSEFVDEFERRLRQVTLGRRGTKRTS
ncbi:MAG: helix-turn-helix transcriptional regulator [Rhodanobacteraceae bacterium]